MRVLLVDDHRLFLETLETLLSAIGFEVIGTASDGFEGLKQARGLRPDLILMDISMPRCDGLAATRLIKAELPAIKIVMLTASEQDEHLFEAVKSGAFGYLVKSLRAPEFLRCLRQVEQGEPPLSPGMAARIMAELARQAPTPVSDPAVPSGDLTDRQKQVLTLVAQGLTYGQAAEKLHLSAATLRYHMIEIMERLHLENRAQVIAYAARLGFDQQKG
jgi:two-component system NarL family response regulator